MNQIYIRAVVESGLLVVTTPSDIELFTVTGPDGQHIDAPVLKRSGRQTMLDASGLKCWTPETPVLYTLYADNHPPEVFGFCELKTLGNTHVLVNGNPYYLRGYIRGIVAHDHPNLTGGSDYNAAQEHFAGKKIRL